MRTSFHLNKRLSLLYDGSGRPANIFPPWKMKVGAPPHCTLGQRSARNLSVAAAAALLVLIEVIIPRTMELHTDSFFLVSVPSSGLCLPRMSVQI